MSSLRSIAIAFLAVGATVSVAAAGEESRSTEEILAQLAAGVPDGLVAENAGCPDVAALEDYLGVPAGEHVVIQAAFGAGQSGADLDLTTPLAAERNGLSAAPRLRFFGVSGMSSVGWPGAPAARPHAIRDPFAGPLDEFRPFPIELDNGGFEPLSVFDRD